ncbi:MAG: tetratricopeptide repeat protein [Pseudomonadota bacterium]
MRVHDPILIDLQNLAISSSAVAMRGQKLADQGDLKNAEIQMRKVLTLRDPTPTDYGNLATVLSRQGKYAEALTLFEKGLAQNSNDVILLSHQGLAYLDAKRIQEAQASLSKATTLDPTYAEAQFNLGVLRFRQGRHTDATHLFERAISLRPGLTDAYLNLGSALAATGDLSGAIVPWLQLKRIQPDNVALIYNIGLAQARLGNFRAAIVELETGLALAPGDPRIVAALARSLVIAPDPTLRNGERAALLSRQLSQARPSDPVALELLAAALAETGRFAEAIDIAEQALQHSQSNQNLHRQLEAALMRYRQGKTIHD